MPMKRRTFIKTTSAGLLAGALLPGNVFASPPISSQIGLQLYSLRDQLKQDLAGSLKKIADIGYKNLEAAGYSKGTFYGLKPLEFKRMVEDLGMKLISSHTTFKKDDVGQVLSAHKEAGIKYLVWSWLAREKRESAATYKIVAEQFNEIGAMCNQNALRFGYHNHDFEFNTVDNIIPYDLLLNSTDPELVFMQLDLYWITYAGRDPIEYFQKYPGRFKLWHVKDMTAGTEKEMTEVGSGVIDYKNLFKYASKAGMKEFFVEQDVIQGDGFESVKKSFNHLKTIVK